MSRAFNAADSTSRGCPPDRPKPVKSNDSATRPRQASSQAYQSAICSFTLVHVPLTTTAGTRSRAARGEGRYRLPTRSAPPAGNRTGSATGGGSWSGD
jgi:hypothetical protein